MIWEQIGQFVCIVFGGACAITIILAAMILHDCGGSTTGETDYDD